MLEPLRRNQSEACISDLRLDQWHAGELGAEAIARIERHLEHCDVCRERHSQIEAQAEAFLTQFPKFELRQQAAVVSGPRSRSRSWRWGAAVATLAAAAVFVLVNRLPDSGLQQRSGARTKGGQARFGFHVKQGERVILGTDGQEVHPGDQLRFYVSSLNPQYLAILSRDAAGVVSEYYPGNGQSRAIGIAHNLDLDSSVELDAVLGREVLWAVFCNEPFSTASLHRQLQQTGRLAAPIGCTMELMTIEKKERR